MRVHTVIWVMLLSAGAAGLSVAGVQMKAELLRLLDGKTAVVRGQITRIRQEEGCNVWTIEAREVVNQRTGKVIAENIRMLLYTGSNAAGNVFDEAEIKLVTLQAPEEKLGWSDRSRCAAQGVFLTGSFSAANCTLQEGNVPWYGVFIRVQQEMRSALYRLLPEKEASLLSALVLGDRNGLDSDIEKQFQHCGVGAVLVVSGLHLTLLLGTILQLLRQLCRSYRAAAAATLPLIVLFVGLTGWGSSVIRAGVSMALGLAALLVSRSADPFNSLGAAALVLMCIRPCAGGDVGVQLSFLAVAGILILGKYLDRWAFVRLPEKVQRNKAITAVTGAFAATIGATAFTMPVMVMTFGYLPLMSGAANILTMLPVEAALVCGMGAAGFGALGWDLLAKPLGWAAGQAARLLMKITEILADGPVLYDTGGVLTLWLAGSLLLLGILMLIPVKRRHLMYAAALCGFSLALYGLVDVPAVQGVRVTAVYCSSGTAVQVSYGADTVTVLADGDSAAAEAYFETYDAGHVVLLNEEYDPSAFRLLRQIPSERVEKVYLPWAVMPDAWCMAPPSYPVELECTGDLTLCGAITVQRYKTETGGVWRIEADDFTVVIPMAGTDLREVPERLRRGDLAILAYDDLKNAGDILSNRIVINGYVTAAEELYLQLEAYIAAVYRLYQLDTLEFLVDEYGRTETWSP